MVKIAVAVLVIFGLIIGIVVLAVRKGKGQQDGGIPPDDRYPLW